MLRLLTTCVNYGDYLDHTLRYNKYIFDEINIATSSQDILTRKIVKKHNTHNNIKIIITDVFYANNVSINKGAAINVLLSNTDHNGWLLIGDADCIYPNQLKDIVTSLNINNLYGMYRYIINKSTDIEKAVTTMNNSQDLLDILKSQEIQLKPAARSHLVLGYCQLFNYAAKIFNKTKPKYPEGSSCRFVDTQFSRSYFRKNRHLLDHYCIHLGEPGVNWHGRNSILFK